MKKTAIIIISLISISALANSGAHHEEAGIPLDKIGWQAANLGILAIALFIFIRKSMVETFAQRKQDYLDQSAKTQEALKSAELALSEIKNKLNSLENGEQKSLEVAKQEANLLRASIIKDAEQAAEKMKKDAELVIANELNKAKLEINSAIINNAIGLTTKKINTSGSSNSAVQEENFIKQLDQVRT